MTYKFLQVNLNRSWDAYALMDQYIIANDITICIVSEPPVRNTLAGTNWFASDSKLAIIKWQVPLMSRRCTLIRRSWDFVAARIGTYIIVSCYISPQVDRGYYLGFLDELGDLLNDYRRYKFIIGGDFNARSPSWNPGITHNYRGTLLEEWAAERDLRLMNHGEIPTSVNPRGSAVVDLTWMSPELASRTVDWTIDIEAESLSDHHYVRFEVSEEDLIRINPSSERNVIQHPRWIYSSMDHDILTDILEWNGVQDYDIAPDSGRQAERMAQCIDRDLTHACDMAASRASKVKRRTNAYWWTPHISDLRHTCIRARRLLTKTNRKRSSIDGLLEIRKRELLHLYKCARKNLRDAIRSAKLNSWKDLVKSVDCDPWGRPYLLVLDS